jgi:imidazole glycerol-phosphate synthase subunit HisF
MLTPRIIPCLLIDNHRLVKTTGFQNARYLGDPLNSARILSEKNADEVLVLDITATTGQRLPSFDLLRRMARHCRMPFCYGGGIHTIKTAMDVLELGIEKVALNTAALEQPGLIEDIACRAGSQSVVVVLDVRSDAAGKKTVWKRGGSINTGISPVQLASQAEASGAGEVVVNSIDRDGNRQGYDIALVREIVKATSVPVTALGGAGSLQDVQALLQQAAPVNAAAGSLFMYKGPQQAVLINYPSQQQRIALYPKY